MVIKMILAAPVAIGIILILIGVYLFVRRTRLGIQTTGVIVGTAKYSKKQAKIKMDVEAPIVSYIVNGHKYECTADKFLMEGMNSYKKGSKINIRVSRKNPRKFQPVQSGDTAEKILISCGTFMILAYIIMYIRYF